MQKLFYEKIEIFYDQNMLIAKNENFEFFTKLINDKFQIMKKLYQKLSNKNSAFQLKIL